MKRLINKQLLIYLLPTFVILFYCLIKSIDAPIGDFGNYYYGSKFLAEGQFNNWIYDPATFNQKIYALGQRNFFLNYTPVPPLSALVYVPFSFINITYSKFIFNLLGSMLFCITLIRLHHYFKQPNYLLLILPIIFFIPIQSNIYQGQAYFFILYLLMEGMMQYEKGNVFIAAILWALSIHLKISPAFVFMFLLAKGKFKAIAYLAIICLVLFVCSLLFIPINVWQNYILEILPRLFNGEINNTYAVNYQSIQVLLKNWLVPDAMHNPFAPFNNPSLYHQLLFLFKAGLLILTILAVIQSKNTMQQYGICLLSSLLISGYGTSYGLIILVFPLFIFLAKTREKKSYKTMVLLTLFTASTLPFYWFTSFGFEAQFVRLYALLILFLIICYPFIIKQSWVLLTLIFGYFTPLPNKVYAQNYFLKKEEALLIYDFNFMNNKVQLNCFDNKGFTTKAIPLDFTTNKITKLGSNNAYVQSKTSYLINDSLVVYLSDENRGVGLYTLRQKVILK